MPWEDNFPKMDTNVIWMVTVVAYSIALYCQSCRRSKGNHETLCHYSQ